MNAEKEYSWYETCYRVFLNTIFSPLFAVIAILLAGPLGLAISFVLAVGLGCVSAKFILSEARASEPIFRKKEGLREKDF